MNKDIKNAYRLLHLAVILFGLTAILGALIDLSAIVLVWWRVLITSISLLFIPIVIRNLMIIPRKTILLFLSMGSILAAHWITFYGAIKLSNASVALICFATMPFFTGIIEPMLNKKPINKLDILVSIALIPGMIFIVQQMETKFTTGIIIGLFSALLIALFSSLTKKYIDKTDPITISFLQISGALIIISILLPIVLIYQPQLTFYPTPRDWKYLLLLSLVCTSFAYVIATYALKHVTAYNSNLIINLEPIYGILLAILFLNENRDLNMQFYIGASIMFVIAIGYPIWKTKTNS